MNKPGLKTDLDKLDNLKALIPFIAGGILLTAVICWMLGFDFRGYSHRTFHEIKWNERAVTDSIVSHILRHKALDSFIQQKAAEEQMLGVITSDTAKTSQAAAIGKRYYKTLLNIRDSSRALSDSQFHACNLVLISLEKDDFLKDKVRPEKEMLPATVTFRAIAIPGFVYRLPIDIPLKHRVATDDFLAAHPSLGLWALLIILQLTMYPLLIIWLCLKLFDDHHNRFIKAIPDNNLYSTDRGTIWGHIIGCTLICVVFYLGFLESDGNDFVKPQYFMLLLNWVLGLTNVAGYLSAALCLAGMLLIYISVRKMKEVLLQEQIKNRAEEQQADHTMRLQLENKVGAGQETGESADADAASKKWLASLSERLRLNKVEKYRDLAARFNLYFTILAIILTLATLSTSSLFKGLNSLPYIKALAGSRAGSMFPKEYVYLYGVIHSAILLAVYLLVRSQLNELKTKLGVSATEDVNKPTFTNKLADIIVTGSPLIAPTLQTMLEHF